jgi:ribonuclease HI
MLLRIGKFETEKCGERTGRRKESFSIYSSLRSITEFEPDIVEHKIIGFSRGSPGRTGLERRQGQWTIMWRNAHYLGDTATNNMAEHEAVRRRVEACGNRYGTTEAHITIIGDSQVILRHLDGTNRVSEPNLAHVVRRTQIALRRLGTYELRRTLRTGNEMADALANIAMDQQHSSTGPDGTDTTLYDFLEQDTSHATSPTHPSHDIVLSLSDHLAKRRPTSA